MQCEYNELELMMQERRNTGTAWTRNEEFDKNGYLVLKDLWPVDELYRPMPEERGQINYWGKNLDQFNHNPEEMQVNGSLAVYSHPQYRSIHSGIRMKLEEVIGRKLYNTYYYDRWYFDSQQLKKHIDRDACEISVSVHISSNIDSEWGFWIKTPDTYADKKKELILVPGENRQLFLQPGDGILYRGTDRPHWREPMPGKVKKDYKLFGKKTPKAFHQVFFHYVLADGERAHCAFDAAR
jgi:hypothetical protein